MIQPKSPKVEKTAKYPQWAILPARKWTTDFPFRNMQNRVWTWICLETKSLHVRMRKNATDCWATWSQDHFTFKGTRMHVWMLICLEPKTLHVWMRSDPCLNANLLGAQTASPLNVPMNIWNHLWMWIYSEVNSLCLRMRKIEFECDSPQEPHHFAFKRAGIRLWMRFSLGAKSLCIQTHWDSCLDCICMLISSGVKPTSQPNV